jgi:hypothetical protein
MRNIGITNSKEMIGEAMYHYMKENGMKVDGRSSKLTQFLDTHYVNQEEMIKMLLVLLIFHLITNVS